MMVVSLSFLPILTIPLYMNAQEATPFDLPPAPLLQVLWQHRNTFKHGVLLRLRTQQGPNLKSLLQHSRHPALQEPLFQLELVLTRGNPMTGIKSAEGANGGHRVPGKSGNSPLPRLILVTYYLLNLRTKDPDIG